MLVAFFLLLMRSAGMYPSIFWDEFIYSHFSRFGMLQEAPLPSYLYYLIYRLTNFCGNDFLSCARVINTVFFVLSAPIIYAVSCRFVSAPIALGISLLALVASTNRYTAHFMPESAYYFAFWLVTFLILRLNDDSPSWRWGASGVAIGLTALIKVHAIFLLPAVILYFSVTTSGRRAIWKIALLVVVALSVKTLVGLAIAGKPGGALLGHAYEGIASRPTTSTLMVMTVAAAEKLLSHWGALFLLFGAVICDVVLCLAFRLWYRRSGEENDSALLYVCFVLAVLLIVVSLFTVSAVGTGVDETTRRLHMRYYSFAFPLLLIAGASQLKSTRTFPVWSRMVMAGVGCVFVGFSRNLLLIWSFPNYIDCPELFGLSANGKFFAFAMVASIVCMIVWAFDRVSGLKIFLFVSAPLTVLAGTYSNAIDMRQFLRPSLGDEAGIAARDYVPRDQAARLMIIARDDRTARQVLMYLNSPGAAYIVPGPEGQADLLGSTWQWVLLVGTSANVGPVREIVSGSDFSLMQVLNK